MRWLIPIAAMVALALLHSSPALAFSSREAGLVVEVLEELAGARGESVYYDEEAADDWYEFDSEESGLIPAAGFSRPSWREAYERTLKGLIALVPEDEFEEISRGLTEKIGRIDGLSDSQRAEIVAEMKQAAERLAGVRAEGAAYAEAVKPYEQRMRDLAGF